MSQQDGLFWSRPPRDLGGASVVGGRSHGEERRKASPCFLQLAVRGPYVVRHPSMVWYLGCHSREQNHQWPNQCTRRTGTLLQWINRRTNANLLGLRTHGCGWRQDQIRLSTTENTDCFKTLGQLQKETQWESSLRNRNYGRKIHQSDQSSLVTQEIKEGPEESGINANHSSIPSQTRSGKSVGSLCSRTWKKLKTYLWEQTVFHSHTWFEKTTLHIPQFAKHGNPWQLLQHTSTVAHMTKTS